eukprot:CAMPEP_0206593278 /NCGR_PEP_ID=MMETSP0325_2-20121206/41554_1 /ASSEMBLY_ACC=CAM_ASM_000347 /TAXON_ID=2866 /ORGANISM="Crypthecodinium cohnii, Strain Seligo" /LENGTH=79 /DNA_ID=CAMNT_0054103259 /DNA_START=446 /DNA_END=682 /DNA_ORIENTATION=+
MTPWLPFGLAAAVAVAVAVAALFLAFAFAFSLAPPVLPRPPRPPFFGAAGGDRPIFAVLGMPGGFHPTSKIQHNTTSPQ